MSVLANTQSKFEDAAIETMRRIIKRSYLSADTKFIFPQTAPQTGSTASTVILFGRRLFADNILFGRRLFAANVVDPRVVLCCSGGLCVELTSGHKPNRPDEALSYSILTIEDCNDTRSQQHHEHVGSLHCYP